MFAAEDHAASAAGTRAQPREPRCDIIDLADLRRRVCFLECGHEEMVRKELYIPEGTEPDLIARDVRNSGLTRGLTRLFTCHLRGAGVI